MKKQMICIVCPIGCRLTIEGDDFKVSGNRCKRGQEYAKNELIAPKRMVTGTVRLGDNQLLPVKTDVPIPKELIFECLEQMRAVCVEPNIAIGDIIIKNVCNTGANIVATKTIEKN